MYYTKPFRENQIVASECATRGLNDDNMEIYYAELARAHAIQIYLFCRACVRCARVRYICVFVCALFLRVCA